MCHVIADAAFVLLVVLSVCLPFAVNKDDFNEIPCTFFPEMSHEHHCGELECMGDRWIS